MLYTIRDRFVGVGVGAMIREARLRAGLSQTELARRAGVAQPVISAYESDRREPGMTMLTKLIEASGHRLVLAVEASPTMRPGLPDTPLGRRLRRRRRAVIAAAERRGARNVRVFGNVARGEETDEVDVDLLVDLDAGVGRADVAGLARQIGNIVGTEVDVVAADALRSPARARVLAEAIPL